ncbi:MAG: hypothetical protein JNL98_16875 [Bryobacterales bacterium]|nr:hypothetical protein [Bryobacterales bacterium]
MRFAILLVLNTAIWATDMPDFSGTWEIDPSKSQTAPVPPPKTQTLTIAHRDPELSVAQRTATGLPRDYRYRTDGKPVVNTSPHGVKMEATAGWDGAELVIRTSMSSGGLSVPMSERWVLAENGRVLRITRGKQIYVYRKK